MDLDIIFAIPNFVKEASAEQLDTTVPGAIVIEGYRFDNQAAAWNSIAQLKKLAMDGSSFEPSTALMKMVKQASEVFGITDNDFVFNSAKVDRVLVKEAGMNADIIVTNEQDFTNAVNSLLQKRASAPYTFCKECAEELINIAKDNGYELENRTKERLCKLAGLGHIDYEAGKAEINKRVNYAHKIGEHKAAELLAKFANMCEESTSEELLPYIIEGIDEFDRGVNVLNKAASANLMYPEDAFYMTNTEFIQKLASTDMVIDSNRSVRRGELMKIANVTAIRKWASDCGYNIRENASPEEIVDVVKQMPASLREEFTGMF